LSADQLNIFGRFPQFAIGHMHYRPRKRRQLASLTDWVMAGAGVQPVVLALEDVHWADPTTLELLRGVAERGALSPLFVLVTTRAEFRPHKTPPKNAPKKLPPKKPPKKTSSGRGGRKRRSRRKSSGQRPLERVLADPLKS
jgi:hypothetical protein